MKAVDPPSSSTSFSSTLNQNSTSPASTVENSSVVTAQVSQEIQIFQTEWETEPELQKVIDNHLPITFSSRHPLIVSGDQTGEVKFWNSQNGDLIGIMRFRNQISQLEFSVDGAHLAICSGTDVLVYNVSTGKLIQQIREWVRESVEEYEEGIRPTSLTALESPMNNSVSQFATENDTALSDSKKSQIQKDEVDGSIFFATGDFSDRPEPLPMTEHGRWSSHAEKYFAELLKKAELMVQKTLERFRFGNDKYSDDSDVQFHLEKLQISQRNKEKHQRLRERSPHKNMNRTAIFLPGDQYLAIGDTYKAVTLWNYREASLVAVLSENYDTNSETSVSSSGSANSDITPDTFTENYLAENGKTQKTLPIVFNAGTSELITVSDDQTVLFWNPETCMTTRKFKTEESISHLSVSYDGTYLATFHHDANLQATPIFQVWKIKGWDPNNNPTPELCEIPIMPDEPNTLSPIVFSRCNNLASCASIGATFVWEVGNTNTKVIRLITNTVLSVDVFSLFEQSQRARNFGTNFTFRPTVFSPDGGFLATGEFDGSLRLWNLKDNSCEQSWQAHSNKITAITFSPVTP